MRLSFVLPHARLILAAIADAGVRFSRNDGLAMASHVALSLVIALFPFLICVAALAALLGAGRISTHIIHLLFDFWPEGVAGPLAREADKVLIPRRNVLTISVVLTLLVATNGVESLRIALCRAYGVERFRPWWQARLIGVGFVVIGAGALVASAVLVVLWPSFWRAAVLSMPDLKTLGLTYDVVRYGLASVVLVMGLVATHLWLPDARPRARNVLPGIAATLILWLAGAGLYGEFLANVTHLKATYAGLAGILTALIFLQLSAAIFIFGAELNAALRRQANPADDRVSAIVEAEPAGAAQA
ncbi:YihY/virulence factor BrkB family protein [Microvirga sp. BT290]|uniref:YihY/virulence factor BrkB family protein n=2 Tax=Microvirga terrestris TaxID=2791024 RepID=A0ABS0HTL8_9HYPH|nr:YihY/virulence factor BrkB family protein [Microvirga terrestris]